MHSYITKVLLQTKLYERRPRKFRRVSVKLGVSRFECLTPVFWKLNIWVKGLLLLGFYKDCRDHNWIIFGAMKHRYLSNKLRENFCKQHWRPWCCNVAKNPNSLCKNYFFFSCFSLSWGYGASRMKSVLSMALLKLCSFLLFSN